MEVPFCRICLGSDAPLISPCSCKGSSAHVHYSCIETFYVFREAWWDLGCPTCKQPYNEKAAIDLGNIGLAHAEDRHGFYSWQVGDTLTSLGAAYARNGGFCRQRDMLTQVVEIRERTCGHQSVEVAVALLNLVTSCGILGNHAWRRELMIRAVRILDGQWPAVQEQLAVALKSLVPARPPWVKSPEQRLILEVAMIVFEAYPRGNERELAVVYTSLSEYLDPQGQCDLLTRAAQLKRRLYGPEHPELAWALVRLALACARLGHSRRKELFFEEASQILMKEERGCFEHMLLMCRDWFVGALGRNRVVSIWNWPIRFTVLRMRCTGLCEILGIPQGTECF